MTAAQEHRDAMLDVFAEITQDCARLDLRPVGVQTNHWASGGLDVGVQFLSGIDNVDSLADAYDFGPDCTPESGNYTRAGRLDLNGLRVTVRIYTGRPDDDGAEVTR